MTEKKRSAYQREMDEIHLSREKADETLRMMLEENRRLRIKEAERGEKRRISRWIPAAGAAAAAALLLAVGLNMNSAGYRFDQISVEAITATSAQKAGTSRFVWNPDFRCPPSAASRILLLSCSFA